MKILCIIPARKNSKGIKNKNIHYINGKPLIYYTIRSAKESKLITYIIGSTDGKKIARIFKKNKVEVPFLRPNNLSKNNSNIVDVLIYTLKKLEKKIKVRFDIVCLLQPTSPFRKKNEIDKAIKKIIRTNSDSLISLCRLDEPHPYKLIQIKNKKLIFNRYKKKQINNRQQMPEYFMPSGNLYLTKRNTLLKNKSLFGKKNTFTLIKQEDYLNINNPNDLKLARIKLN